MRSVWPSSLTLYPGFFWSSSASRSRLGNPSTSTEELNSKLISSQSSLVTPGGTLSPWPHTLAASVDNISKAAPLRNICFILLSRDNIYTVTCFFEPVHRHPHPGTPGGTLANRSR